MSAAEFAADDRFAVLSDGDIACHGGTGLRDIALRSAVAWLLDRANDTSFVAVLDPSDETVATLDDDGDVVWEPLADFAG